MLRILAKDILELCKRFDPRVHADVPRGRSNELEVLVENVAFVVENALRLKQHLAKAHIPNQTARGPQALACPEAQTAQ